MVVVAVVVVVGQDMSEDILNLNRRQPHVQYLVRKTVAVSLAHTWLQSEMRTTVRLVLAGTRHLRRRHPLWTLSLQSMFLPCYHMCLRVAYFSPKTLYSDIHALATSLGAPRQRRRGRQARPARLHRVPIRRARPHIHRLEHARPRARRNSINHQPRRRLSRGRGEENGPAQRVEHVQDRAPPRVPGLYRPARRR